MSHIKTQLHRITAEYVQEPDCHDEINQDGFQTLTVTLEPTLIGLYSSKGEKEYFYHMKTDRWSFDDPKELFDMIKDLESKLK